MHPEILIFSGPMSCSNFRASKCVAMSCAMGMERAVAGAIIHTGAGDNVGNQSNICRGQPDGAQRVINVGKCLCAHGKDDILFMMRNSSCE